PAARRRPGRPGRTGADPVTADYPPVAGLDDDPAGGPGAGAPGDAGRPGSGGGPGGAGGAGSGGGAGGGGGPGAGGGPAAAAAGGVPRWRRSARASPRPWWARTPSSPAW